jgi:phenylalanyl-tRNA synthetase alpha subunit
MGKLAPEERAAAGKLLNSAKQNLEAAIETRQRQFAEADLQARLEAEWVDLTCLPGRAAGICIPSRIQRELEELFASLGFAVLDGPEVETEYHIRRAQHSRRPSGATCKTPFGSMADVSCAPTPRPCKCAGWAWTPCA